MAQQTVYLSTHLERDVCANHLLSNAQALATAGSVLGTRQSTGRDALDRGLRLLESELAEQILDDGGHYERSPMYHCQVLEDNLAVWSVLEASPDFLTSAIKRMVSFLKGISHPDGDIPLFGDSVLDSRRPACALSRIAGDLCGFEAGTPGADSPPTAFDCSGFFVMPSPETGGRLIAKAGPPGPGYQLGHAHCDMLGYELSLGPERFIVDTGVSTYEPGPWRDFCRSTRAHNTVSLRDGEQMECWGAFRVGRRFRPLVHGWGEFSKGWYLRAGHDGYSPFCHERFFFRLDAGWVIMDRVSGPRDTNAAGYVHFHPDVVLTETRDRVWHAARNGKEMVLVPFEVDEIQHVQGGKEPIQGWYCPEFGKILPASCLILKTERECPFLFGYGLLPGPSAPMSVAVLRKLAPDLVAEIAKQHPGCVQS